MEKILISKINCAIFEKLCEDYFNKCIEIVKWVLIDEI